MFNSRGYMVDQPKNYRIIQRKGKFIRKYKYTGYLYFLGFIGAIIYFSLAKMYF